MKRISRVAPAGLEALLGVLGFLQYRWTGALSLAEKERMENGLRSSMRRFSADVDDELVEAVHAWRSEEGASSLIAAVYVERSGETFEVLPDGALAPTSAFPVSFDPRDMPLVRSPLALVIPMTRPRGRFPRRRPPSWVIVALDRDYLRGHVIPAAASHHLADYDVVVRDDTGVFWESEGADAAATVRSPDGVGWLLAFRPFGRGPGPGRGGLGGGPPPQRSGPAAERGTADASFRVFARHRAGSLQAAVDRARSRNLGVGFGVLAVLGASIVLLTVSSRRATDLSERKMEFVAGVSHELRTPIAVIVRRLRTWPTGPSRTVRRSRATESSSRRKRCVSRISSRRFSSSRVSSRTSASTRANVYWRESSSRRPSPLAVTGES